MLKHGVWFVVCGLWWVRVSRTAVLRSIVVVVTTISKGILVCDGCGSGSSSGSGASARTRSGGNDGRRRGMETWRRPFGGS
jgi:hypothetical protein